MYLIKEGPVMEGDAVVEERLGNAAAVSSRLTNLRVPEAIAYNS